MASWHSNSRELEEKLSDAAAPISCNRLLYSSPLNSTSHSSLHQPLSTHSTTFRSVKAAHITTSTHSIDQQCIHQPPPPSHSYLLLRPSLRPPLHVVRVPLPIPCCVDDLAVPLLAERCACILTACFLFVRIQFHLAADVQFSSCSCLVNRNAVAACASCRL